MSGHPPASTSRMKSDGLVHAANEVMKPLGTFCEFKYGRSLPSKDRQGGDFPVYGSNGIVGWHHEPITNGPTIIIGRKGSAGALQYSSVSCCPIDTTYYVDRSCTTVDLKWLFFMLQMLGLDALNKHAAVPGLNRNDAYEKELIVPSSNEQRRIAAVLEKADALRRLRQESLQLTEKLLQSVFIDMFGDPVRNSKHLPTKELCQLAKLERGKFTPRPRNDPSYYNGQYPFIQTGDITRSKGRITSWTQTLNDKGAAVSKEFTPGTVVIAIVGATIGETAIVETPVYCPDSIIGITPFKHKATPEFIEFLLRQWKPRLKQMAPDAARANLNLERLRPLPALSPSIEEQEEFSRIARMLRSHLLVQQESEMQLSYLFSSLQQRAFRGDLDLSRVRLDSQAEIPTASDSEVSASQSARPEGKAFLIAPGALENELERLATLIRQDGPMPWSADYFKYRVLGIMPTPFSFDDLMQRVSGVFSEEPPYEEIKDIILELLGQGGGAPLIRQRFGTSTIEETTKAHDYKQIVLEPIA